MTFKLPFNDRIRVRCFDKVETTDPQYAIRDLGLQYQDGSVDSIVFGGSFATARGWFTNDEAAK